MAKRKLTAPQRLAIRKDLAELLRKGKSKAETLSTVAKKYGVTTVTARWYLKTTKGLSPAPAARKQRKALASSNGYGLGNGAARLVATVQAIADKAFTRASLAKKLIPRWQLYVRKEVNLRKVERAVRQQLESVARKVKTLHRQIRKLTTP